MPSTHPITKNGIRTLLRQRMFHIDAAEVTFSRRGFVPGSAAAQGHLEQIGTAFLSGYHAAIDQGLTTSLAQILSQTDAEYRGFAFEGAGMGLGLLDSFSLRRGTRWQRFVDGIGRPHRYVVHVGLGWVVARLPWLRSRPEPFIAHLHPLLKWLVMDGYGFHEGYFHWQNWSPESLQRPRFRGYASRAFDQGLGRCLWFVLDWPVLMPESPTSPNLNSSCIGLSRISCTFNRGSPLVPKPAKTEISPPRIPSKPVKSYSGAVPPPHRK